LLLSLLQSCTPALVFVISMFMRLQSPWPLWQALPVLVVCAGAGVATFEGDHIFSSWRPLSPVLQVTMIFLQAGSISLLQKVLQPRTDVLPHAMGLSGRTSSSGSSLLRTGSTASHSSRTSSSGSVSDDDDVVTPAGPSPLAVLTHIAWYAMLVLVAPVIMLEARQLITTFAGWRPVLPTLLASSSTFVLYSLMTIIAVQASSAVTVSLMEAVVAAAVTLVTAFLYPWNSSFPAGVIPVLQWQGLGVAVLGLACYAWGKVAVQRAAQLQRRASMDAPTKTAAYWASEDPAKVMKCSGADVMVYIQPHRVRQAAAATWVQPDGFKPLSAIQDVMPPQTPVSPLQQQQQQQQQCYSRHYQQQQLVYCQ
jgi:hypothetical protein